MRDVLLALLLALDAKDAAKREASEAWDMVRLASGGAAHRIALERFMRANQISALAFQALKAARGAAAAELEAGE